MKPSRKNFLYLDILCLCMRQCVYMCDRERGHICNFFHPACPIALSITAAMHRCIIMMCINMMLKWNKYANTMRPVRRVTVPYCICSDIAVFHRASVWRTPVWMAARPDRPVGGGRTKRPELKNTVQSRKKHPPFAFSRGHHPWIRGLAAAERHISCQPANHIIRVFHFFSQSIKVADMQSFEDRCRETIGWCRCASIFKDGMNAKSDCLHEQQLPIIQLTT